MFVLQGEPGKPGNCGSTGPMGCEGPQVRKQTYYDYLFTCCALENEWERVTIHFFVVEWIELEVLTIFNIHCPQGARGCPGLPGQKVSRKRAFVIFSLQKLWLQYIKRNWIR